MNTTIDKDSSHLITVAETYYAEMLSHNFDAMAKHLHPSARIISPLAEVSGKENIVEAAKNLTKLLTDIEFRAKFSAENQVMLAYHFVFIEPIGKQRASVLMSFEDELIKCIELFYDARPFEAKMDEIFTTE